ncbi:MAG: tRNA (adenosine(37)-N6)-threonylcarbamoyltransferase complex dimerization subunit type 1 TsaB [Limnohabitans sp.]|nr:tRNA (adenosine(37)-N6)-threonylcarbamoyltransferase complex dimerization subunit type 1 TsaB [Limnohabitans sp.]
MKFLTIDTSTELMSVAVGIDDQVFHDEGAGGSQSSAHLIAVVMRVLKQAGIALKDLNAIVFSHGPGSFTGLRTACAVSQGLALGADLPVIGVDSLLAMAQAAKSNHPQSHRFLSLMDARMNQMYAGAYQWHNNQWACVLAPELIDPHQLSWPAHWHEDEHKRVCGNAFSAHQTQISDELKLVSDSIYSLPNALALLALAPHAWLNGQARDPDQAFPMYIREKVAQTTAERRQASLNTPCP